MLQEILLSLSGHPSPLLRSAASSPSDSDNPLSGDTLISPPERALLASLAHLSDLHVRLLTATAHAAASHPSVICRAVAAAVDSAHLAAFRRKVLEVEATVLRRDAALVGAYDAVPLTAVVAEFTGWERRLEWLSRVVEVVHREGCTGARLIDFLRGELQTGYRDVEEAARSLVGVAEAAWVKQVAAWVLYGRLPGFEERDFFVVKRITAAEGEEGEGEGVGEEFACEMELLPGFVTPATAASMLFIGKSLNQIRAKSAGDYTLRGTDHLSTQLTRLAALRHPIDSATFARTIADIRQFLSRTTLQRLLPLSRVLETLQLLRDFFLLRRGEFAMALTQQADEKIRSRWKRAENLAYEKREGLTNVTVKEGEVAAVLARTWAAMGVMQGEHAEEDEGLELARDLLRLSIAKSRNTTPMMTPVSAENGLPVIAPTPFRNLLFSVPVVLTLKIPSPLDLFLSHSDLQTYTAINSYLLSLRRAHIRLTDLWKITSLRRHHPAPPGPPYGSTRGGRERVLLLRQRHAARSSILRNSWATASAAIFFLGEVEGYLQTEVVAGLSDGFHRWLTTGEDEQRHDDKNSRVKQTPGPAPPGEDIDMMDDNDDDNDDDIWLAESTSPQPSTIQASLHHDPQTLATSHRQFLHALANRLLLTQQSFTDPLYELLVQIDHLVALIHRLHSVWTAADLETDAGVVDAFVDLEREERDVQGEIRGVERRVKKGIEGLIAELRRLEGSAALRGGGDGGDFELGIVDESQDEGELVMREYGEYVPRRVGGIDRLLMKLDFGTWFGRGGEETLDDDDGGL